MNRVPDWLARAERILVDASSSEAEVDEVIGAIGQMDANLFTGSQAAGQIDPVVLDRVIAVVTVRRDGVAAELADLARQRAELAKRHRGVAGYATSL